MSLRINNNVAAINAHRNLVLTTMNLSKSMEKLSSGYQINRAADDPAGLVISEQFRAQIAGLNRAISNSEGSINMIQTAEGALNELNNLLISMRELAIHAANEGFNDTNQLQADQAEIDNAISTIDRIAANTQFGTKKLLDGTKANIATITSANSAGITIKQSGLSTGAHSITATKTADSSATINTTSYGVSLDSTVTPYNLADGIHNIDVIQASAGASKTSSSSITVLDAWSNGITFAAAATSAFIDSSTDAAANATASNAGTYSIQLNFQENGEAVTGWQTLSIDVVDTQTAATAVADWNTAISSNAALVGKVEAIDTGGGNIEFKSTNTGSQYSIAQQGFSSTATTDWFSYAASPADARGASQNSLRLSGTFDKTAENGAATVTLTAGSYLTLDALVTELNAQISTAGGWGTTTGGGAANIVATAEGADRVRFTLSDEGSDYNLQVLAATVDGSDSARAALGMTADGVALTGTDALVSFDSYTNTISAVNYAATSTVTIANKADGETGRGTVGLTIATASQGVNLGSMLLDVSAATFDVRLDAGPATGVTAGVDTLVYNANRTESVKMTVGLNSNGGSESITNTDQSLVFQIGANVGQTASIGLDNMSASSLGRSLAGNMFASLAQIDVTTVQGAQDAQRVIDESINEVSTARGTLGSFQKNTLESNLRNLRIASQNLQSSESNIRDTDMAKEMSVFVKNQILLQAGTSMLAQANQVPQAVLGLFG